VSLLKFSSLTIAQRLWLGLGLIFGLFALADLVSLLAASRVDTALRTLVSGADQRREATYEMRNDLAEIIHAARRCVEDGDPQHRAALDKALTAFEQALAEYKALASTERSRDLAQETRGRYDNLKRYTIHLSLLANQQLQVLNDLTARQRKLETILSSMPALAVPSRESAPIQRLILAKDLARQLRAAAREFRERVQVEGEGLRRQIEGERVNLTSALARYRAAAETPAERAWAVAAANWSAGVTSRAREFVALEVKQRLVLEQAGSARAGLDDLFADQIQPAARAELVVAVERASLAAHEANLGITRALLLALVLGGLAALATMRAVRAPLGQLVASSRRLADGDFSHRISSASQDELGELTLAFNEMAEKLQTTTVSRSYLGSIVHSMGEALVVVSRMGIIHTANPAAEQLLGYVQGALPTTTLASIVDDGVAGAAVCSARVPLRLVTELRHKQGFAIPVSISAVPMLNQTDTGPAVVCIAQDLRERLSAEQQQRQADVVLENTKEGIVLTDENGAIVLANPAFRDITHYEAVEAKGMRLQLLWSNREDAGFVEGVWSTVKAHGQWQGEIWMRRKDGELRPVWKNISAVRDASGQIANFVVVFSDISAIKEAEERLNHLAYYDALTNLPNRILFGERLRLALNRAQRSGSSVALLYVDLDDFKHVNDTLGHEEGDRLLQEIARRLPTCVRANDAVARLGGDEFTVVLEDVARPQQAARVAEKILEAIGEPFELSSIELRMSASIGICLSPLHGVTNDELLMAADAAMYRAKHEGGRSYQFFSSELTKQAMEQLTLRNALRHPSLHDQLVLHYQPQVALRTGRIVGVEALVRWQHPTQGPLSPGQFIPVAEEAGLIHTIGEWVLKAACIQAKAWQEMGYPPLRVAVNVSAQEIRGHAIVDRVERSLAQTGLEASLLEIEVTEGALQSGDEVVEVLEQLRRMGVRLALDDFGVGYSSLSSIKSLPFHRLKIDRSFIRDLPHAANDRSIARAIIAMGRSLNLEILAEGVETLAQLRILQDEGCHEVQGFLLGHPMLAEALDTQFPDRLARLPESAQKVFNRRISVGIVKT
jgi:diguanylate cyclase (GGDEF)-like protein/PAS domain S-box-containing protein